MNNGTAGTSASGNTTNSVSVQDYTAALWIWAGIMLAISVFGALNNALVILAVWHFRELQNAMNVLLVNLAIVSLLHDLVSLPLLTFSVVSRLYLTLPTEWCHYFGSILQVTTFTITLSVAAISVNRFVAVVFPHVYRRLKSRRALAIFAAPCWIFPSTVAVVGLTSLLGQATGIPPFGYCALKSVSFIMLTQAGFIYFPTAVMAICYLGIVFRLILLRTKVVPGQGEQTPAPTKYLITQRAHTARRIFYCFVVYVCVNYPTSIYRAIVRNADNDPVLFLWTRSLSHSLSLLNPVLYGWTNRAFRAAFLTILRGGLRGPVPESSGSIKAQLRRQSVSGSEEKTARKIDG